uniref:Uncharacterized protein n=1 Tax=Ectopseudomonas mendocina (strain ymp) TaxID=399739 RepID=A4XTG8_ECTM1
MQLVLRLPYLAFSIVFVLALYVLCAAANYAWLDSSLLEWLVYEEILNTHEDSFLEVLSAVLWLLSCVIFLYLFLVSEHKVERFWLVFYAGLSFFAFGEEISWGHHLLNYSEYVPVIAANNAQGETNLHNINVAALLGLSEDFPYYRYLANLSHLLNPLFYLFLSFLWLGLPLVKKTGVIGRFVLIKYMPVPSNGFLVFFFLHSVVFVFVDVALFNVGYIYEMYIALAALIVGLDIFRCGLPQPATSDQLVAIEVS